ncbi:MAG: hypothetical protein A2W97_08750 [Bacteroidetes bacterium GWE2_40_63]|nr:MAG: hypothetical protein A2W96_13005 [Bacteroidetes bacterium GWD2_40_43]OFX92681.1 MAG: hypothetical protein A2W97_08750 [Bacteroidetes bacterium GWE2_40_63]OFY17586.1 MAG: hypothetical protein A2W88_10830 [Bacteroidetes bacterium GWF2_40_13]HBX83490.1 hypothetical protein [Marinilabiliales bacterium]HCC29451.1 hypothetical protein [Marinilabiliales bacterium]
MKTTFKISVFVLMFFLTMNVSAQEKEPMKTMPLQISLVTPIGTNGMESWNTINNVSLNYFGAYSGGLSGFEASGFFNVLKSNMSGVQMAGFFNADMGKTVGAQFAGFVNYNHRYLNGAQFAGFVNVVNSQAESFQGAGFVNVTLGDMKGAQFAGFVNTVHGDMNGFQGAGFTNYSQGNHMGQISGFVNTNIGDLKGVQISGFANLNTGAVDGAQIAGFVNITKRLKGVQLGVFNYVDSLEDGLPIGVLSIVRNGYRVFELGTTESLYGMVSFKIGTKKFYNILSAGMAVRNDKLLWSYGYGIGTQVAIGAKADLNFEGLVYHVNEDEWQDNKLNLLNKIQVLASWNFSNGMSLFGGPSFNGVVSDLKQGDTQTDNSSIPPYSVWKKTYSNGTQVVLYPGFSMGVRF